MCGRYQIVMEESELREIIFSALTNADLDTSSYISGGEVFPTNILPVLINSEGQQIAKMYKWGFPQYKGSGVIINARAETLEVKPTFANRFRYSRCIVPSNGFYEWSKSKQKYLFNMPDDNMVYMAGLWGDFNGQQCYVIITKPANESVMNVHDRMPLVLRRDELDDWLFDVNCARLILNGIVPELRAIPA